MRVKRLTVENFRSFREVTLDDLSDIVILIGENDCGKSNLLEAIRVLFEWSRGTSTSSQVGPVSGKEYLWFGAVPEAFPIRIGATLALTEADRQALEGALSIQNILPQECELQVSFLIGGTLKKCVNRQAV